MRRLRGRQKEAAAAATRAAPLMYERADWHLFMQPESLPQKAGCGPDELGRIVLKELTDNALDVSAKVTIEALAVTRTGDEGYRISDQGPGIDPADVPKLFAVNRPLLSSKL